jgi:hypothetical protein
VLEANGAEDGVTDVMHFDCWFSASGFGADAAVSEEYG